MSSAEKEGELREAAGRGDVVKVKSLIKAGVNVGCKDKDYGLTPLHYAARYGHANITSTLIEAGADHRAKDNDGDTPLHKAAFFGLDAYATLLLEAGADRNAKNNKGNTPLHVAALWGRDACATLLLEAGADRNAKNNKGETPADKARNSGEPNTAHLIDSFDVAAAQRKRAAAEAQAKRAADDKARRDAEARVKRAAEEKAKLEAEALKAAQAKREAEQAKLEAEQAKRDAEQLKLELAAEQQARRDAEKQSPPAVAAAAADDDDDWPSSLTTHKYWSGFSTLLENAFLDAKFVRTSPTGEFEEAIKPLPAPLRELLREMRPNPSSLLSSSSSSEASLSSSSSSSVPSPAPSPVPAPTLPTTSPTQFHLSSVDIKIKAALGAGNFGEVFAAKWNGVPVAVKKLSKKRDDENSQAAESELLSEAGSLGVLRHPFVLGFFGVSRDPHTQQLMVVTELADGGSVESLLQDRLDCGGGCLPLAVALRLLRTAASGVEYIHERGIAHRDIAARNVFLRRARDGGLDALIGDLGLACAANYYGSSESGESANKVSTKKLPLKWMSPESAMRSKFNGASDVWMFGVFAWELFGGCAAAPYTNLVLGLDVAETKARLRQRVFTPPFAYSLADERPVYCAPTRTDATATAVDDDTLRYDGRAVRADEYPPPPTWAALCSCWRGAAATRPTMRELRRTLKRHAREPWTPSSSAADTATVVTAPATTVATTPATTVATTVATANLVYAVQRGDGNVEANTEKKKEKEKDHDSSS